MSVRKYKAKDVDMLIAAETIVNRAISEISFLGEKRPKWKEDFFPPLLQRIQNAYSTHLGIDNASQLREATQTLYKLQSPALKLLAEFKVQIEQDFKSEPTLKEEILNRLGFKQHHNAAIKKDQEALIELLNKFKTNLTPEYEQMIIDKGMHPDTMHRLIDVVDQFKNANITQEVAKGSRKDISRTAVAEFNAIYDEIVSICKIASTFYKGDPVKKDMFSFSKTVKTLNAQVSKPENPEPEPVQ